MEQCKNCGSLKRRHLYTFDKFSVVRCKECTLAFLEPFPNETQLTAIYENDRYYRATDYQESVGGYADYLALREHLRFVIDELLRPVGRVAPGTVLDVGCGMGIGLDRMRELGWQTFGVDVSPFASAYAREQLGLDVVTGTLQDLTLPAGSIDLAISTLVIEHLAEPYRMLLDLSKLMRVGGTVVIGTHDIDGLWPRLAGRHWRHFDIPEHVHWFSRATLTSMVSRAGFNVSKVTETATLSAVTGNARNSLGMVTPVYLMHRLGWLRALAPGLRAWHRLARSVNISDGVTVYAQKA